MAKSSRNAAQLDIHFKIAAAVAGVGLLFLAMSPLFKWVNFANGGMIGLKTGEDGKIVFVITVVAMAFYGAALLKKKWLTAVILGVQAWGTVTVFWMGALIWRVGSSLDSAGTSGNPFVTMLNMQLSPGTGLYLGLIGGIGVAGALGFLAACRVLAAGGFKHYYATQGLSFVMGIALAFYIGHGRASTEDRANSELLPDARESREAADRSQVKNNFKQIGLAMHNFHDTHKHFPAAASTDMKGKQLLSWRVHILPFVDQARLYEQFHRDEPWDSEHNKTLIKKMPEVYASPYDPEFNAQGKTRYLVARGKGTIFDGNGKTEGNVPFGANIRDIRDGTENTILALEVAPDAAVLWTKPDDLTVDFTNPLKGLTNSRQIGFHILMADGAVRFGGEYMNLDVLKAKFTRDGGEVIDNDF